jgi:hypothetical protein
VHKVKSHKSVEQIAKKHRLDVSFVQHQLEMGIPIEHEHTRDKDLATDIALQHLDEIPDYYTRLKKMESDAKKEHKKFKDVKEHCGCEDNAIEELESGLKKLNNTSYDSIDSLMRRIMKKHDMTAKQLHNAFVNKNDKTPDNWIKDLKEGTLHHWFKGSKSKNGTPGWVQADGSPCANEPGETKTPKCFSSARLRSLRSKGERGESLIRSAVSRKREKDKSQQAKTGSAAPTNVPTFAKGKKDPNYVKAEPGIKEAMELNEAQKDKHGKGSGKKDACYYKVKSRYDVWPSAYASGALVKCRKVGAANWGEQVEEKRYCGLCRKNESKNECKYGPKMWLKYSKHFTPNTPHPGNFPESFENKDVHKESSFEIGPKHNQVKKKAKIANLLKGTTNKNEQEVARKILGNSPKLPGEQRESVKIEDADGNLYAEFIDLINPEPMKSPKSTFMANQEFGEEVEEKENPEKFDTAVKSIRTRTRKGKMTPDQRVRALMQAAKLRKVNEAKGTGGSPGQEYDDPMKKGNFVPAPKNLRKTLNIGTRGSVGIDPKNSPGNTNSATSECYKKTFEQFTTETKENLHEFLPALAAAIGELGAGVVGRAVAGEVAAAAGETMGGTAGGLRSAASNLIGKKVGNVAANKVKTTVNNLTQKEDDTSKENFSNWRSDFGLIEASAAWQRKEGKNPEGGLNKKGISSYRKEHPGSHLSLEVTTEPSKLKPGSKKANRRKSFCSRMKGMKAKLTSAKTAHDPNSRINKSLRKWNC